MSNYLLICLILLIGINIFIELLKWELQVKCRMFFDSISKNQFENLVQYGKVQLSYEQILKFLLIWETIIGKIDLPKR